MTTFTFPALLHNHPYDEAFFEIKYEYDFMNHNIKRIKVSHSIVTIFKSVYKYATKMPISAFRVCIQKPNIPAIYSART